MFSNKVIFVREKPTTGSYIPYIVNKTNDNLEFFLLSDKEKESEKEEIVYLIQATEKIDVTEEQINITKINISNNELTEIYKKCFLPRKKYKQNNVIPKPTENDANFFVFSMYSLRGIKKYLTDGFPVYEGPQSQGVSCSVVWSGKDINTPTDVFRDLQMGLVINPYHIDVQHGDFFAYNSKGLIVAEEDKKNASSGRSTNHPLKRGCLRENTDGEMKFVVNKAKYEVDDETKTEIYHSKGNIFIYSRNVLRKVFKKHKDESEYKYEKETVDNKGQSIIVDHFNEAIAFKKSLNSLGLIIKINEFNATKETIKKCLKILELNPHLKIYFHDETAKENQLRYLSNENSKSFLHDYKSNNEINLENYFQLALPVKADEEKKINKLLLYNGNTESPPANPFDGIVIRKQMPDDAKELINILTTNPSFKLYFYDETANENIVRYMNNQKGIECLSSIENFDIAFEQAKPFTGYDEGKKAKELIAKIKLIRRNGTIKHFSHGAHLME